MLMCHTHRYVWDSRMTAPKLVTRIDEQTEIFQYVTPSTAPFTARDHCLLRQVVSKTLGRPFELFRDAPNPVSMS